MSAANPDELDLVPGFAHEQLQGKVWESATAEELREGLEKAFDYRGDVTLTLRDGSTVEGYIFDRRADAVRLISKNVPGKQTIAFAEIRGLAFTGRDTAAGKSWEAWVKKYFEKKAAGEKNIEIVPEKLD